MNVLQNELLEQAEALAYKHAHPNLCKESLI